MATRIVAPGGANTLAESVTHDGLTREQLLIVLESVAGRAYTVNRLLMQLQASGRFSYEAEVMLDAAQQAACTLGAMADAASGANIIGSADEWHYGPNFAAAGKAGAA